MSFYKKNNTLKAGEGKSIPNCENDLLTAS